MTCPLIITTTTSNYQIVTVLSKSTSNNYTSINFSNNISSNGYIGIGGPLLVGAPVNNLYLQADNAMIFLEML